MANCSKKRSVFDIRRKIKKNEGVGRERDFKGDTRRDYLGAFPSVKNETGTACHEAKRRKRWLLWFLQS